MIKKLKEYTENFSKDTRPFLPRKPDEYFLPDDDDGSWEHQRQIEEQEQEIN